jgi:hypothetical protein
MTRDVHLAWAKQRALAYLPTDPAQAAASMLSDLSKHPDLLKVFNDLLADPDFGPFLSRCCRQPEDVRKWIEGFA